MRSIVSILYILIAICGHNVLAQTAETEKSIAFADYSPVAFRSFWQLPEDSVANDWNVSLDSRYSVDHLAYYITEYAELSMPFGHANSIRAIFPYHYFKVTDYKQHHFDMDAPSGSEMGDIDVIISVGDLEILPHNFLGARTNSYLTFEMHTAPTDRDNRQFTDVMKFLGSFNIMSSKIVDNRTKLSNTFCIGGGGWGNVTYPHQLHALKFGNKFTAYLSSLHQQRASFYIGGTYLLVEGAGANGMLAESGLNLFFQNTTWTLSMGTNVYFSSPIKNSAFAELSVTVPFQLHLCE